MASQVDPAAVVREQLAPGERLLWSGAPVQGLRLQGVDAALIPFSLFWGGFAFFWEWMAVTGGAPWFFALWGLPFMAIGAYLIAGRFFWDAHRRSQTFYGVTDQRVIIVVRAWSTRVTSLPVRNLTDLTLAESAGRGSIRFGSPPGGPASGLVGTSWPGAPLVPTFDTIPDARRVHELIRESQRAAA